jgi:hypothetical protein
MADFRQIHTQIWKDTWFLDLETDEKLLFIYLFSNERACLTGLYDLSDKVIAFETDMDRERIAETMARFEQAGKIHRDGSLIWIPNLMRYNANNITSPKIQAHLRTSLSSISDCPLKRQWIEHYNSIVPEKYRMDTVWIPYPGPESEQEQEQEHEQEQETPKGAGAPQSGDCPDSSLGDDNQKEKTPVPANLQEWLACLDTYNNHPALVHRQCEVLFPNKDPPAYGLIGKAARKLGTGKNGYARLMCEICDLQAHPPQGDIIPYILAKAKGNGHATHHRGNGGTANAQGDGGETITRIQQGMAAAIEARNREAERFSAEVMPTLPTAAGLEDHPPPGT